MNQERHRVLTCGNAFPHVSAGPFRGLCGVVDRLAPMAARCLLPAVLPVFLPSPEGVSQFGEMFVL